MRLTFRSARTGSTSTAQLTRRARPSSSCSAQSPMSPPDCRLRRVKYLNNVIDQDHRFIRRRWRAMQCFRSFHTAERTLEGAEAMHVMRKGQVKRLDGRDAIGRRNLLRACSVSPLNTRSHRAASRLNSRFATLPATVWASRCVDCGTSSPSARPKRCRTAMGFSTHGNEAVNLEH